MSVPGNGQRFGWKVGVVQLIQADRVGDKNGFLSLQPTRGPTLSNLLDGERCTPLPSQGEGEMAARGRLYRRWKVAMFSEWTASRAAGKTLEDVIRRQWAVPSTHNPPTWECVSESAPNLMLSVTIHPPDYEEQSLLLRSGRFLLWKSHSTKSTYIFKSEPGKTQLSMSRMDLFNLNLNP